LGIPEEKTLQRNVKMVEALTLERINVALVEHATALFRLGRLVGLARLKMQPAR
jgi:hypothetical protein